MNSFKSWSETLWQSIFTVLLVALLSPFALQAAETGVDSEGNEFTYISVIPELDERCTINILNGSARVEEDGSFTLLTPLSTDVPYRARAICDYDGDIIYGESALLFGVPSGDTEVGEIFFDQYHPIPVSLRLDAPTTQLDVDTPVVSLTALAELPNGTEANLTPASQGTVYSTSSDVVTVSEDGVVTAKRSGRAIVSARHEGVMASLEFDVFFPVDSDSDGMPDDYEIRNGLDPASSADAQADKDGDGLSNYQEYLLGTSPLHVDSDGDTINDADEGQQGTDPLLPDTDSDGLVDGEELLRGTDPLSEDTDNDGISDSVEIHFGLDPLTRTETVNISGRVVDDQGEPVNAASVVAFNTFSAISDEQGYFRISPVPVVQGDAVLNARVIRGGIIHDGNSVPLALSAGADIDAGDIEVASISGAVFGSVLNPRGEAVVGARLTVEALDGEDTRYLNADYQGMFQISDLPQGDVSIVAQDPRTGLYGLAEGVLSDGGNLKLDIQLRAFGTIKGKVLLADGLTSAGDNQQVTLKRHGGGHVATTATNAFGEYQFEFVPLGEYTVEAFGDGRKRARSTVVLSGTTQINNADLVFLGVGSVSGFVESSSGARMGNLPVTLYSYSLFQENLTTTTNSLGEYRFDEVYVGDYHVTAIDESANLRGWAEGAIEINGQQRKSNITLSPTGSVTGMVYNHDGSVAAGAEVAIGNLTTVSAADGSWTIHNVSLGSNDVIARTGEGDYGRSSVNLTSANDTVSADVTLAGLGSVEVTVTSFSGKPVPDVSVTVMSSAGDTEYEMISGANGSVTFNKVLAGQLSISVFDPIDRLGGNVSTQLNPQESISAVVKLQPAADIRGVIYHADGVTPAANVIVKLLPTKDEVVTGSDGKYQFNMRPLDQSPYRVKVFDSGYAQRARSDEFSLLQNGEIVSLDLTMIGNGTVAGYVYNPGGTLATGIPVTLTSYAGGERKYIAYTDSTGRYEIQQVPATGYEIEAVDVSNRFAGTANGELTSDGDNVTTDIAMLENQVPGKTQQIANFFDGNGFSYGVLRGGTIADGTRNVFRGDGDIFRGAGRLDILFDNEIYAFDRGATRFLTDGRETAITKEYDFGLTVERRLFVPRGGYFARAIETVTNNTDEMQFVELRLDSHYQISNYDREVNGTTVRVSVPMGVVTSSSGDGFLNISSGEADRWVIVDDDMNEDPFINNSQPALVHLLDGEGAGVRAQSGEFLTGASGGVNRMRLTWLLAISPGKSRSIMHFLSQQTDRTAAQATVQRLQQLPPESLEGITAEDAARITNFNVSLSSAVTPLPQRLGSVAGQVFEFDGVETIAGANVAFQSEHPLYRRVWTLQSDDNGLFNFVGKYPKNAQASLAPVYDFMLTATHPMAKTRVQAAVSVSSFSGELKANKNLIFSDTAKIDGTVRRFDGVVASYGYVELMGGKLNKAIKTGIDEDGRFSFKGLEPGSYHLVATLPDPNGTSIGGSVDVQLSANQQLVRDITLSQVNAVSGVVRNGAGAAESGVAVTLNADGFERQIRTDSAGYFEFLDVPLGDYELKVVDRGVGGVLSQSITVAEGASVVRNFALTPVGELLVNVVYDDNSIGSLLRVQYETSKRKGRWLNAGSTSAQGRVLIRNVPVGDWQVKVTNPGNANLTASVSGSLSSHGEQQSVTLELAKDYPPAVTITSPGVGYSATEGDNINIMVDVSDDYGVEHVQFFLADKSLGKDYTHPYSLNAMADHSPGVATLKVVVKDTGGNFVAAKQQIEIVGDEQRPTIQWVSPQEGAEFIEGQQMHYQFDAQDNVALRGVELQVNGEVLSEVSSGDSGIWTIPGDYASGGKTETLTLVAKDIAGNAASAERVIKIKEDEPPSVTWSAQSPAPGTAFVEASPVSLALDVTDDVAIDKVELYVNEELQGTRFVAPFKFDFKMPQLSGASDQARVIARAYDSMQQTADSTSLDLVIEKNQPPTVKWNSPANGSAWTEGEMKRLSVEAADDIELTRVDFYLDGVLIGSASEAPYELDHRLAGGVGGESIQLTATAVDNIDQRTSALLSLTRRDDVVAPSVQVVAPTDGSIVTLGDSDVVIVIDTSGSAGDGSGADVDGDGNEDSILAAEVHASKQLLDFLNPLTTQVAVVDFSSSAIVAQGLSNDFEAVDLALDQILAAGASGGTEFDEALEASLSELVGERSRPSASSVVLFMSDGSSSYPSQQVEEALDAAAIVNTFAVGQGANGSVLEQIASATGGVATEVPDASKMVEILPRTILFGLDSLTTLAEAEDDIAVKQVTIRTLLNDGSVLDEQIDDTAPYSLASALPSVDEAQTVLVQASAKDYGDNVKDSDTISVTLLPAQTSPTLLKLESGYVARGNTVKLLGQYLIADGSDIPSSSDPSQIAVNQVYLSGTAIEHISATKTQIVFKVPENAESGELYVSVDGIETNRLQLVIDDDQDGLSNEDELLYGTDPEMADTDSDGLADGAEVSEFGTDPTKADTDDDGINDQIEIEASLDPLDASDALADADGDGVSNLEEVSLGTDLRDADSDNDGLNDGEELVVGTDPLNRDSDSDGLDDGAEGEIGSNPLLADTDADGIGDQDEVENGLDPTDSSDAVLDKDGDGLSNLDELGLGTDINDTDSDNDGLNDFEELNTWNTSPTQSDSDHDGDSDGLEVSSGTDPNDPQSSVTVRLSSSLFDSVNNEWNVTRYGSLRYGHNVFDPGFYLELNGSRFYDDDSRAIKVRDNLWRLEDKVLISNGQFSTEVSVLRDIYVSDQVPMMRYVETVQNDSDKALQIEVHLDTDLNYDSSSTLISKSSGSGNAQLAAVDNYAVFDDQEGGGYQAAGMLWSDDSATVQTQKADFAGDNLDIYWNITVPAKSSVSVMHFVTLATNQATVSEQLADLAKLGSVATQHLSLDELNRIANFGMDADGDGLPDPIELAIGTSTSSVDSDGDGLGDRFEYESGLDPLVVDDLSKDHDNDGLSAEEELAAGTLENNPDTDKDGLGDGDEIARGTDPLAQDTDNDGLTDGVEVNTHGTSPSLSDSDADGIDDGEELEQGWNPLANDTDGDGLKDNEEASHGLDPANPDDAAADLDGDGLSNLEEVALGTHLTDPDTDMDGLSDGEEVALGTSPMLLDSDSDGDPDGLEVDAGTDPLDPNSTATISLPFDMTDGAGNVWTLNVGGFATSVGEDGGHMAHLFDLENTPPNWSPRAVRLSDTELQFATFGAAGEGEEEGGSLEVVRTVKAFAAHGAVRYVDSYTNHSSFKRFVPVRVHFALPSIDTKEMVADDASNTVRPANSWARTPMLANGSYAAIAWGASAGEQPNALHQQNGIFYLEYSLTIEPSETVSLLHILATGRDSGAMQGELQSILQSPAELFGGLSDDVRQSIINMLLDSDGDGLGDFQEGLLGTDPMLADTDSDGLLDGFEAQWGFDPLATNEAADDTDSDGLDNLTEQTIGSSPLSVDTDDDGLSDRQEFTLGTSLQTADTDADGLIDGSEVNTHQTNPLNADTDGDEVLDGRELQLGLDPLKADTDGDSIPDGYEVQFGLNAQDASDASLDLDNDGMTNLQEYAAGSKADSSDSDGDGLLDGEEVAQHNTSPIIADSDADGLPDGFEVEHGFDALTPGDGSQDADSDGLDNLAEMLLGTNPTLADTDGDGVNDNADEVPLDPALSVRRDVLLVADLGEDAGFEAPLISAIEQVSLSHQTVSATELAAMGGPAARHKMAAARLVLWTTGAYGFLDEAEESLLASYLNGGGCALLSSQDHVYSRGTTYLLTDFFGIAAVSSDATDGTSTVAITAEGRLYPTPESMNLRFSSDNYSDVLSLGSADTLFRYGEQVGGSLNDAGNHLAIFTGFPLETLGDDLQRGGFIKKVVDECGYFHRPGVDFVAPESPIVEPPSEGEDV